MQISGLEGVRQVSGLLSSFRISPRCWGLHHGLDLGWDKGSLPLRRELETSWLFMRTHSRSIVCNRLVIKYNRLLKSISRLQLPIGFPNHHTANTFYVPCSQTLKVDRTLQTKTEWVQQRPLVVLGTKQPKRSIHCCVSAHLLDCTTQDPTQLRKRSLEDIKSTLTPPLSFRMGHWAHKGKVTWPRTLRISLEVGVRSTILLRRSQRALQQSYFASESISSVLRASGERTEAVDEFHSGFCQMYPARCRNQKEQCAPRT